MKKVKCLYCEKEFDRDVEPFRQIGRRYAHKDCKPRAMPVTNSERVAIINYCIELFGKDANISRITLQLRNLIESGKTYNGVMLTLKYWYEVKKSDKTLAKGALGIVPHVYGEARNYWRQMQPKRVPKMLTEEVVMKYRKREKLKIRKGE